jgi:tRNA pseudouridine55 synthase
MLGVVNLDKPIGPTSHDMVGLVRRLTGTRRVGHAGTLDPLASGVLPILVGAATRFSEELSAGDKRYEAVVRLGARSRTDDAEGPIELAGDVPPPTEGEVTAALPAFVGTFEQRPPAFSARKLGGQVAYRAARAGEPLPLPARRVTIHALDLLGVTRGGGHVDVSLRIRCAPGTYIRSLARDLGEALGCGGYLLSLRRTAAAGLSIEDAITPRELEALAADGRVAEALLPLVPLLPMPRLELKPAAVERFRNGAAIPVPGDGHGRRAVVRDGALVGIGELRDGLLRPVKVVAPVDG